VAAARTKSQNREGAVETYILTGICLVVFIATVAVFRFLMEDRDTGVMLGLLAGLVLSVAAGGAYYAYLARCTTCV